MKLDKWDRALIKMALNGEILDIDQRLRVIDKDGDTGRTVQAIRGQLKGLVSRIEQLEKAA